MTSKSLSNKAPDNLRAQFESKFLDLKKKHIFRKIQKDVN